MKCARNILLKIQVLIGYQTEIAWGSCYKQIVVIYSISIILNHIRSNSDPNDSLIYEETFHIKTLKMEQKYIKNHYYNHIVIVVNFQENLFLGQKICFMIIKNWMKFMDNFYRI